MDEETQDVYNEFMEHAPEEKIEETEPEEKIEETEPVSDIPLEFFEMIHDKDNGNVTMSKETFKWFIEKLN